MTKSTEKALLIRRKADPGVPPGQGHDVADGKALLHPALPKAGVMRPDRPGKVIEFRHSPPGSHGLNKVFLRSVSQTKTDAAHRIGGPVQTQPAPAALILNCNKTL